jgi:hypothetical protein
MANNQIFDCFSITVRPVFITRPFSGFSDDLATMASACEAHCGRVFASPWRRPYLNILSLLPRQRGYQRGQFCLRFTGMAATIRQRGLHGAESLFLINLVLCFWFLSRFDLVSGLILGCDFGFDLLGLGILSLLLRVVSAVMNASFEEHQVE